MRPLRKPLVVMTPKSLLRHPKATSSLAEFESGGFQRVIPDSEIQSTSDVQRVILCSGKVYYDLLEHKRELDEKVASTIQIHRVEQLYPLSETLDLQPLFNGVNPDTPVVWVQEEPKNQGAWPHLCLMFGGRIGNTHPFSVISRPG